MVNVSNELIVPGVSVEDQLIQRKHATTGMFNCFKDFWDAHLFIQKLIACDHEWMSPSKVLILVELTVVWWQGRWNDKPKQLNQYINRIIRKMELILSI